MSVSLTPSKRQHENNSVEVNVTKTQKTSSSDSPKEPRKTSSGGDVFRVLCPTSKIESLVGEVESIILQIRNETGAKVRIDSPVPGCDERVIFIMGPDSNTDSKESESTKDQDKSEDHNENGTEQEGLLTAGDAQSDKTSSLVRALLLVLEKIVEGEQQTDVSKKESNGSATITFRLLVLSSQVGCLLGRGGSIIKQMSTESGAQIRVVPKDKLPQCGSSADDVVQITGLGDAVKKAIKSVSQQMVENSNADQDSLPSNSSGPSFHSRNHPASRLDSQSSRPLPFRGAPFGSGFRDNVDLRSNGPLFPPRFHENIMPNKIDVPEAVTFRLLCPDDKVGSIIGKGGAIIKTIKHETGCEINVLEGNPEEVERVIVVSGPAYPEDKISAVQDAVLRILNRLAKATPDTKEQGLTFKFLVSSNQIGCLLGKGGAIIGEMRKVTGAFIRVLGKDQVPKSASEDEVVQINGELEVIQDAVMHITTRLQHHFFRDAFPSAFADRALPFAPRMGRGEHSPPFGPPFRNFDSIGGPPFHGGLHPFDDHPPFMREGNRQGLLERPWPPQALIEGDHMGLLDYGGPHQRRMSEFRGGGQQPFITNTTVEVVVPSSLIPSICGEDGGCLRQIRQISEARIVINEPRRAGAPETLIIISGTPEQTHAAQSLIQAFVMLENESS
ncbi:RNA-binding KH domain-containing protein RCF3-like [Silene latifolia]|uniref:RNA-binding KH domain-containing protein RCF3-like n=1 Tax=Silene latifolia TaxID=37657 RepID=UPI003D76A677